MGVRLQATDSLKTLIKEYYDGLFAAAAEGRPTSCQPRAMEYSSSIEGKSTTWPAEGPCTASPGSP